MQLTSTASASVLVALLSLVLYLPVVTARPSRYLRPVRTLTSRQEEHVHSAVRPRTNNDRTNDDLTRRESTPSPPPGQIPYTFYHLELITQQAQNAQNIRGKPYERFFQPDLFVYPEMIEPGRREIDCDTQALKPDLSDLNSLLVPEWEELPNENAWCAYKSGAAFVASRTHFPGASGEMAQWWMWWHSAEKERYSLWHPWAHVSVSSDFAPKFTNPSLNATEKLYGSVHKVTEIIGDTREDLAIHWFPPSHFGLDESRFNHAGIVANACGEIYIGPLKVIDMIHLWYRRKDGDGLELRSRYFIASKVDLLGVVPLEPIASPLGVQNLFAGRKLAQLQFHHDQQEFTHLAGFLPDIYRAFGDGSDADK